MSGPDPDLDIRTIEAFPISLPLVDGPRLALGRAVKRDAVIVKVTTAGGLVGYGEAHHGRAAGVVARIVDSVLPDLVLPASALDVVGIWRRVYDGQLRSHGLGAATVLAMSGLDMALWDIRGKAARWPLYRMLGGTRRDLPAYAGGVALGWQPVPRLVEEVAAATARGYRAVKLRVGERPDLDAARVSAVRAADERLTIMVDANTAYSPGELVRALPSFEETGVEWIEEPFAPQAVDSYRRAAGLTRIRLAAGENLYTRYEFAPVLRSGFLGEVQPDVAKTGGVTEFMRIAALASAAGVRVSPHSSVTGLSQAATVHVLSAIDNPGFYESDVTPEHAFRERLTSTPHDTSSPGTVRALDAPGLGVRVDEDFIAAHPFVPGPNFVP
ncbi:MULTISPECIES: mandelate racemase/muconate lactonizing enzyme family protein [Amycolatopsis]|uniref:L-alanine-DL-glutamate epimerase n=2 Tax=Amycolatopsis TaxID=1813 RepID=A0A1I3KCR1_9PSEU|nr:mandelate racemase/muconate lactonizing enzyme family protein [Amycolatopsis sacchari]SFI70130.1 L-alanine-DL-glutamate epimerase [Amycolatopsis sacchari]